MKDIRTVINIMKQLNYILSKKQRKMVIALTVVILVGSVFELLGVSSVVPFVNAVISPDVMWSNRYVRQIADMFHITTDTELIVLCGIFIILVFIIKNVYLIFSSRFQIYFRYGIVKELSVKLLDAYIHRPYTYFLEVNSSEVMRGITSDVDSVSNILGDVFNICVQVFSVFLIGIYLISLDSFMALGVLLLGGISFFGIIFIVRRKIKKMGEKAREATAAQYQVAYQAIHGIKEIKVMDRSRYFVDAYAVVADKSKKARSTNELINVMPERLIESVCIAGIIGIVCIRVLLGIESAAFISSLAGFGMAAFRLLPAIARITGYISGIIYGRPALEATYENLKGVECCEESRPDSFARELPFQKKICIDAVSWKYKETMEMVLERLSMDIHKGEAVAFIGSSGAGKTTLADIILGLLPPLHGAVMMDGTDILTIKPAWAKTIGYIPQSVFLIDDTIRNNVAFGLPETEIDDNKIWQALEQAQIKDFVEALPNQLETQVGERGVRFSGGQRQRVAIARALYYDPEILVMDEATSALDNETETALMESIDALHGKKTLITIAHRLSTIRNCDKIYEIRGGRAYLRRKEEIFGD